MSVITKVDESEYRYHGLDRRAGKPHTYFKNIDKNDAR